MRGRKPVPTVLRKLRGNPGKRAYNADEPQPEPADAETPPPAWLHPEAQQEWTHLAPMLRRVGLLSETDLKALTLYCEAYGRWREASDKIREFGMVIKAKNGYPVVSPYVQIANKAWAQAKSLLVEFGMTPSARSRVNAYAPAPAADEWSEFDGPRLVSTRRA